jgi:hypothetical protein
MTGFWDAAERVRSGATAQAGPRPVSRFEGEGDASAETDFEQVAPLADDALTTGHWPSPAAAAEPRQIHEPPLVAEQTVVRETVEIRAEPGAAVSPGPSIARPAPVVEATPASPPAPATAPAPPVPAPTPVLSTTIAPPPVPQPPLNAGSALVDPPGGALSERLVHETATERTTVIVEAAPPPPDAFAPLPRANGWEADGLETTAPSTSAAPPAFNIQIDRIEIRIDSPSAPAAPVATRRPAPPVDLNDYLARRGA